MKNVIKIPKDEQYKLIENLRTNIDIESKRILRYYDMPDLSRTLGNPVNLIVEKVVNIPQFKNFDIIETPEVAGIYETFDLFGFAPDHSARSKSDTYYVSEDRILRTHTTIMWYYYLTNPNIKEELENNGEIGVLSYGKVYRKDEIDKKHMNVFHQIDGLYICAKDKKVIGKPELVEVLVDLTKSIYGDKIGYQVLDDTFPYTDPSAQIEVKMGNDWLEILGSGVVKGEVLANLGIDSSKYNGWAFGPGIERLAMVKMGIPDMRIMWSTDPRVTKQWGSLDNKYEEVSKYPAMSRDISFIIDKDISLNDYYGIIQDIAGNIIEEVKLLDTYENEEKFGAGKVSYTWRIIYRSLDKTLTTEEVNEIQEKIRISTVKLLGAELR